jgi:hypothetical protein
VSREEVLEGYGIVFINSHAIYYTITPSTIFIVRVLHEQMDPGRAFIETQASSLRQKHPLTRKDSSKKLRLHAPNILIACIAVFLMGLFDWSHNHQTQ